MKKVLLTLLVALGIAGQAVAQDDYSTGWIVTSNNAVVQTSSNEMEEEDVKTLEGISWIRKTTVPKGTLMIGWDSYVTFWDDDETKRIEPYVSDGYIYAQGDYIGQPIYRMKQSNVREVEVSYEIPLKYGNGVAYNGVDGKTFKIVPLIANGKLKYGDNYAKSMLKPLLSKKKCYVLLMMSSNGKITDYDFLEKTKTGFRALNSKGIGIGEGESENLKISKQGKLLSYAYVGFGESPGDYTPMWLWVESEKTPRLVIDYYGIAP